ncbi:MAG TPA: thiolase family protein [Stenomitos sp.]
MREVSEVVIVSAVRTPYGKFGGALKDVPGVQLAAHVIQEALKRANLSPDRVDEVYLGTCVPAETGVIAPVVARQALLLAGMPEETVSMSLDRACCSSMTAIQMGLRAIQLGEADVVLAVGAENLSRAPYMVPSLRFGARMGHVELSDPLQMKYPGHAPVSVDTGHIAQEHGVGREDLDAWAYRSQQRYQEALAAGKYDAEIAPIELATRKGPVTFARDEFPKPETTPESLAKLPTVYGSPTVTAGNAPGLDAGATAILLMSKQKAEELGLKPLATVLTVASVAGEPKDIVTIPAKAIEKGLAKTGLQLEDLSLIEINEAFAAMPLVSTKLLGGGDAAKVEALRAKTNVNGGAIAIGHPVGASGARIVMALVNELKRRGGGYGAASICGGLGQGDCTIVKV